MRVARWIFLIVCVLFSGCAGTYQYRPLPDQSKKIENPEYGRIYVIRPSAFGFAVGIDIYDNGKLVGRTGPQGYLSWEREPGEAVINGYAENRAEYKLEVYRGETYYIKQAIQMGIMMARTAFYGLGVDEGQKLLKKAKVPKLKIKEEKGG